MACSASVESAQNNLKELIGKLSPGEEMLLTDGETPIACLIALPRKSGKAPKLGGLAGTVLYMAPDFDASMDIVDDDAV